MTEVDGFLLPRHEQDELVDLLGEVPGLVEDLAITMTRQDKFGGGGPRVSQGETVAPLPFNEAASEASGMLRGVLAKWVRRTVTARKLEPPATHDTLTLARWLRRWVIALALTPDSDLALGQIKQQVRECRRICDRPAEKPLPVADEKKVAEADDWMLNANGLANLAREMGDKWLTEKRINTLLNKKHVMPVGAAHGQNLYRVGDVREAHEKVRCVAREKHEAMKLAEELGEVG